MSPILETERVRGEPLSPAHLDLLVELHGDERVMATLGGVRPRTQTADWVTRNLSHWDEHGFGIFVFRDRETGEFIGRGSIRRFVIDGAEETEIGYVVVAERWGAGIGSEIARALVRLAFEVIGLSDVVAFTRPGNAASRRVMEKVGFAYEKDVEWAVERQVLYRLRASS